MKTGKNVLIGIIGAAMLVSSVAVFAATKAITIKGSDTMVILAQRWAEKYMAKNPGVSLQVTGGGSGTGISALINGTTDICNASRAMKKSEREKLKQRYNTLGVEIPVAQDGITLYVHESNPVDELSLDQIRAIYLSEIKNWKEVGGADGKIILYGRENSSGTYVYFRDHVLNGADYSSLMQTLPGTAAVVNAVSKDRLSIGYGGAAYAKGIKKVNVRKDASSPAYEANVESMKAGNYPIARYLYMYTRSKPAGDMKLFIDWVLSAEGQAIISEVGYFPVK
ncbi:MAG: phosphate ABC transporter substrate-binding protein [Chitinispirillaceae bacterium]|jgi:phosphate transport system substrate-binding protein|nr:phosphate ABC transporter substrate-binding protein [Chitinispirillaceae bacterium]